MIDEVWLPAALRFGISMDVFWGLNPKYLYMYQEEYIREKEEQMKLMDIAAYYQGLYVQQAIGSCFSKRAKYPKKPLSMKNAEKKQTKEMTEEEYYDAMKQAIRNMNKQFTDETQ